MNTLKGSISSVKFLFRAKNVSIACSLNIGDGHMFLHTSDGDPGAGASVKDESECGVCNDDSRLQTPSCKNIYDPGSHTEMRAAQKYSFLKTDESL